MVLAFPLCAGVLAGAFSGAPAALEEDASVDFDPALAEHRVARETAARVDDDVLAAGHTDLHRRLAEHGRRVRPLAGDLRDTSVAELEPAPRWQLHGERRAEADGDRPIHHVPRDLQCGFAATTHGARFTPGSGRLIGGPSIRSGGGGTTGIVILVGFCSPRTTLIVGFSLVGQTRGKSAPPIASRSRWPFATRYDVAHIGMRYSSVSPGSTGNSRS